VRARRPERPKHPEPYPANLSDLRLRHDTLVSDFRRHVKAGLHDDTRAYLKFLCETAIQDWKTVIRRIVELNPRECQFEPRDPNS
jgi:hypothetical protein